MTFLRDLKFALRSLARVMKRIGQAARYLTCGPGWTQSLGAFTAELSESGQNVPGTHNARTGNIAALCVTRSWERT
jgi:hypothetical protein